MHIPDGYLSPDLRGQPCGRGTGNGNSGVQGPQEGKDRHVPTLAVLAAVCFLIMMFNVPIPDGTTAHA